MTYLSLKNNFKSPIAEVETISPVPTLRVISPSESFFKNYFPEMRSKYGLVAPESSIQVEFSYSTKHVSTTSKSYLPCVSFSAFFSARYFGQFLNQCPFWPQW